MKGKSFSPNDPRFYELHSADMFLGDNQFSPELKNTHLQRLQDAISKDDSGDMRNYGAAQLKYPSNSGLSSEVYTGVSGKKSRYSPNRHGEREATLNALNGEIKKLRTLPTTHSLNPPGPFNKPHNENNIRRPSSPTPEEYLNRVQDSRENPYINSLRRDISRDRALNRMSSDTYFGPLKEWMNKNGISLDVLTERPPCKTGDNSCSTFFQQNLPKNSNIGSNYKGNNEEVVEKRNELLGAWNQQQNPSNYSQSQPSYQSSLQNMGNIQQQQNYNQVPFSFLQQKQQYAKGGRVINHAAESQRHRNNLRMIREFLDRM